MQVYAPRDPLQEFFRGQISLRKLDVMVRWLPPTSPVHRAGSGTDWGDPEILAWDVSTHLRQLVTQISNLFREKGRSAIEPEFLPTPFDDVDEQDEVDPEEQAEIRTNMERLWGAA